MDCPTCEAMIDAYVDGELSATESAAFEAALPGCPDCRRRLEETRAMSGFLRDLPVERAPDLLRVRVERELRAISSASRPQARPALGQNMRWMAMAASLIVAASIGWVGGTFTGRNTVDDSELVSTYLRVASSDHPVDVASTDRHTVKPWFAGRIDYAPPVRDLTTAGFPLEGGRLDVVAGRKVSVLVYRHNQHRVALSLWPATASGNTSPKVVERNGFVMAEWRRDGFEIHAVSDLGVSEMVSFAAALDRATGEDR
ncbi:MAG: anti-sigma factor [Enhydrobacter sp.]